jgi:hypothetical protein
MMRRGLRLRPFLEDLIEKTTIEFNRERRNGVRRREELPLCLQKESLLSEKDWVVIELMEKVLTDFEEALRMLEGDARRRMRKGGRVETYGNMWDVASTYEFLMDKLEEWKATAENYPDPEHFKININLGWDKLNDYSSVLCFGYPESSFALGLLREYVDRPKTAAMATGGKRHDQKAVGGRIQTIANTVNAR